jgi:hypothetical protein
MAFWCSFHDTPKQGGIVQRVLCWKSARSLQAFWHIVRLLFASCSVIVKIRLLKSGSSDFSSVESVFVQQSSIRAGKSGGVNFLLLFFPVTGPSLWLSTFKYKHMHLVQVTVQTPRSVVTFLLETLMVVICELTVVSAG